jgi:hypothetical protein
LPLPPPVPRDELHLRRVEIRGYRRHDGLYDMEARITDTKTDDLQLSEKTVPAGERIHDMWLRLTVDEALTVHDVMAATDASPFAMCPQATGALAAIKGLRIGPGWTSALKERLQRADNCTHLVELLAPLATTAFQTLAPLRNSQPDRLDKNGRPLKMNSCYAYASKREVALRRWPQHYDGPPVEERRPRSR